MQDTSASSLANSPDAPSAPSVSAPTALAETLGGTSGTLEELAGARSFCFVFGMFYGLLGMLGFIAGRTMALLIPGVEVAVTDSHLLAIIPDTLILSTNDHVLHIVLSLVFLLAGLLLKPGTSPAATLKSYEPCVME